MHNISKTIILSLSLSSFASCKTHIEEVKNPNIVYFLVDDMGIGDLSIYGQNKFSTPHIDQLAQKGMVFSKHYCGSSVSGPSRASLMTGKHIGNNSVRGNWPCPQLIDNSEATLASVLKKAGYKTACIGKWGIGDPIPLDDPKQKGFDHFYGYLNMYHAHNCFPEFLYRNNQKEYLPGNRLALNNDSTNPWENFPEGTGIAQAYARSQYAPHLIEREAIRYIQDNQKNPFFLYYTINLPHANNEATPNGCEVPDFGEFADKDWSDVEKGFAQMMRIIDNQVGSLVAELEKQGILDNTLIMFASDNGAHEEGGHSAEYFNSNGNFRDTKRAMYEGGIHTPFIVRWDNKIVPGSSTDHLSAFWDILPTFCDLTNQEVPENIDGISILPTLLNKQDQQDKHPYLYFEFYEEGGKQALVTDEWKYIKLNTLEENGSPIRRELYNLKNDPSETTNVITENPQLVSQFEVNLEKSHTPFKLTPLFKN